MIDRLPVETRNSCLSEASSVITKMMANDATLRQKFRVSTGRRSIKNPPLRHFACILRHAILLSVKIMKTPLPVSNVGSRPTVLIIIVMDSFISILMMRQVNFQLY